MALILDAENLSGCLALPEASLLERPVEFNGFGSGTFIDTGAAIPAFVRMQDYGRLTLLGIGYVDIYGANLDTAVAAVADLGIKNYRTAGCSDIGLGEHFFLSHDFLLFID
jgi:hypothetical protein